jgi:hypothetical protein
LAESSLPLCLEAPAPASEWSVHDVLPVVWRADTARSQKIVLEISRDNGRSYAGIAPKAIAVSDGRYDWEIPDTIDAASIVSAQCMLRASEYGREELTAFSGVFSIAADRSPPAIVSLSPAYDGATLSVGFSESLDRSSAETPDVYAISPDVTVQSATLAEDGKTVHLTLSGLQNGASYTLTVSGLTDRASPPNQADNLQRGFEASFEGVGLTGEYYDGRDLEGAPALVRIDPTIDFSWDNQEPAPGLGTDDFSIRWRGFFRAPITGLLSLYVTSDDGARLWIDGNEALDEWHGRAATEDSVETEVENDRLYAITLEYFEAGGQSLAALEWSGNELPREIIPTAFLYPDNRAAAARPATRAMRRAPRVRHIRGSVIITGAPPEATDIVVYNHRGARLSAIPARRAGDKASDAIVWKTTTDRGEQLAAGMYLLTIRRHGRVLSASTVALP